MQYPNKSHSKEERNIHKLGDLNWQSAVNTSSNFSIEPSKDLYDVTMWSKKTKVAIEIKK